MSKLQFCRNFVYLDRRPISFAGRPYLPAIYAADDRNLVLRSSRQTEKSTFLVNVILSEACQRPGSKILFVSPRREQALLFARARLLTSLEQSPLLRRRLLGKRSRRPQVTNMEFANGSLVHMRAAFHSGDACRGVSADLLLVDEFQDIATGDLPILEETMSHAPNGRTILTGTPKSVDNHLEAIFRKSTANEWTIDCPKCGKGAILDERSLGPRGVICPECVTPLDPIKGRWVARNPQAKWGAGFSVNHLMVPWLNYDDVLLRQETYDIGKFKNEVLGLSTTTGDHVVTRAELEACCGERAPAESYEQVPHEGRDQLVAGIDWGGGGVSRTVLVIGYLSSDNCFRIQYLKRFAVREEHEPVIDEIIKKCRQFRLRYVAADGGGNGSLLNRLLYDRLPTKDWLFGITYAPARHEPRRDGVLWKWMIDRTASIGAVFTRVKKRTLLFPKLSTSATFLDEFACEVAEYDDINRTVRYSHPETMQDDALHATNYALALGVYLRSIQNG